MKISAKNRQDSRQWKSLKLFFNFFHKKTNFSVRAFFNREQGAKQKRFPVWAYCQTGNLDCQNFNVFFRRIWTSAAGL